MLLLRFVMLLLRFVMLLLRFVMLLLCFVMLLLRFVMLLLRFFMRKFFVFNVYKFLLKKNCCVFVYNVLTHLLRSFHV
jgi:hypothetical protein